MTVIANHEMPSATMSLASIAGVIPRAFLLWCVSAGRAHGDGVERQSYPHTRWNRRHRLFDGASYARPCADIVITGRNCDELRSAVRKLGEGAKAERVDAAKPD